MAPSASAPPGNQFEHHCHSEQHDQSQRDRRQLQLSAMTCMSRKTIFKPSAKSRSVFSVSSISVITLAAFATRRLSE
ncbi:hypothetical protein BWQ96_06049 [Gracilariopsis chorda]|uniref:Uncharacterized protein n=1 Tax=Gracilariopsis chorda TaxID=448386 RepID=A0A2V3IQ49_9FLOR|nr:hypothetical protein BWQ96_06049 [Gracilariopsis chorda]|eukprot:PXF44189.1 hypothetical protein BWQ96_06049 [Gracilariopsis chorda]